jgi:4-hydroxybenzoate polyprenyltransferase
MTVAALGRMVRFSHSLFALPFAVSAVALVFPRARLEPWRLLLVALAVVAARTAAMSMNRIADVRFDARNPRTARRELVTGEVSPRAAWALLAGSAAAFVLAAALIGPFTGLLSVPVLAVLLGYSYAKRFTWASQLWLGVAQALGPVGVAVALTGDAPPAALLLGLGVGAWIAGFDVFYALQDM